MASEAGGNNKGTKRKQRYRPHNKPVKKKGAYPLTPGIEGFFITCDGGREHQAAHEALSVIDTFFEELVDGKDTRENEGEATVKKVLNKKITFSYSSGSEEEADDDENEQEDVSEKKDKKAEDVGEGDAKPELKEEETQQKENMPENEGVEQHDGDGDAKPELKEEETQQKESVPENEGVEQHDGDKPEKVEEPPVKKQCCDSGISGLDKTEKSVDQLIEAELKEMADKNKRRFMKLESGCNGVVIIKMKRGEGDPGPKEIVQRMMESAASTRKHMSRHLLRILPIEVSCYSSEEEISRAIKPIITKYFPVESDTAIKFAVQYDHRANTGIDRMKIIDAVAKSVPKHHKVDLKDPEKSIVVQIVKTVCLIGVVEKYKELAKFNLRQLTSGEP